MNGRIVAYYPVDQYGILVAKIDQPALNFEVSEDCGVSWTGFRSDGEFNGVLLHALRGIVQERVASGEVKTPTLIEEKIEAAPKEEAA